MNINEHSTCIACVFSHARKPDENGLHIDRVEPVSTRSTTCIHRWIQSNTNCIRSTCVHTGSM